MPSTFTVPLEETSYSEDDMTDPKFDDDFILNAETDENSEQDDNCCVDPLTILLADDDSDMALLLSDSLTRKGYEVTRCRNGYELLECIAAGSCYDGNVHFDLILSDLRMPQITGIECLELMKPASMFPPMILMTAFGDEATERESRALGAVEFLRKPFEIDYLLKSISDHLENSTQESAKARLNVTWREFHDQLIRKLNVNRSIRS